MPVVLYFWMEYRELGLDLSSEGLRYLEFSSVALFESSVHSNTVTLIVCRAFVFVLAHHQWLSALTVCPVVCDTM